MGDGIRFVIKVVFDDVNNDENLFVGVNLMYIV